MKLSSFIPVLLQLTVASAATTKVIRKRSVESTSARSLSSAFDKQQEYLAKLPKLLADNGDAVAAAKNGSRSNVSEQCFTDTFTNFGEIGLSEEELSEEGDCTAEGSFIKCDFSSLGLPACTEAGGIIVRDALNFCEENFIASGVPFCVAPSCDESVTYSDLMVDFGLPLIYELFGGEEVFMMTLEEYITISGYGTCDAGTSSSKAPKSSKMPKSSKSPSTPSSKAPKASKSPKATSAPSSKAPKASTKAPKSTKSPGAAASSSATASMSAASVAAGALVWFSL